MGRVRLGWLAVASLVFLIQAAQFADAKTKPVKTHDADPAPAAPASSYDWTGFYAGMNVGAAWGSYDPTTSTSLGSYLIHSRDVAAVNAAGAQNISPLGFIGGGQAGYNWQADRALLGLEVEADYLHLLGSANSNAIRYPAGGSGFFNGGFRLNQFVISSYANADWLMTLRPRVGVTADNWLFYLTGGLALTKLQGQFLFTDGNAAGAVTGAVQEADVHSIRAGYALGGGVEAGLNARLSVKAEYLYVHFGNVTAHQVSSNFVSGFTPPSPQNFTQSMDLSASILRLGLNYRFGGAADNGNAAFWPRQSSAVALSDWQFDVGTRLWFSSGKIGAPQPLLGSGPLPSTLNSRLTYINLDGVSGETFGRADHVSGFFVKGYVGAGGIVGGNLIDEDFPGFGGAYSSTVSPVSGSLGYVTLDLGYTFLKGPGGSLGAFVGYNYFRQHLNGFGCSQAAGDTTCTGLDPAFQVFAEDDHFNSLRLGLTTEFWLTDALKFNAEAAYVPYTTFRGQDDHNFRELLFPELAPTGNGVMLESILSYAVTRNWNVGAGGRYWAFNSNTGSEWFDALGLPLPTTPQLGRFNTERYGVFVQTDYHWGEEMSAAGLHGAQDGSAAATAMTAPNWSGSLSRRLCGRRLERRPLVGSVRRHHKLRPHQYRGLWRHRAQHRSVGRRPHRRRLAKRPLGRRHRRRTRRGEYPRREYLLLRHRRRQLPEGRQCHRHGRRPLGLRLRPLLALCQRRCGVDEFDLHDLGRHFRQSDRRLSGDRQVGLGLDGGRRRAICADRKLVDAVRIRTYRPSHHFGRICRSPGAQRPDVRREAVAQYAQARHRPEVRLAEPVRSGRLIACLPARFRLHRQRRRLYETRSK